MKKNVVVREYTDDDFENLIGLYKNSSAYGGKYDESRDTREKLLATAEDLCLFVATLEGALVGSVMILDNPHSFWLLRFCIDQNSTVDIHNETAKVLLETTERIAQSRGHKSIIVYTSPDNEDLVARYEQLSFAKAGQYSCFWRPVQPKEMGL